jgi:hypothetical protein
MNRERRRLIPVVAVIATDLMTPASSAGMKPTLKWASRYWSRRF